ncbi:nucleotidyl transferase AbiEii/AbiGii toxin family protein [archaeon]|nr:nucleotidyl transferase AbiEii/AbiGii toxin family protein [archaeon]
MILKEQLSEIAKQTGLHLYQQEKDYLLKLFLFNYYKHFEDAVFKGGTCIKFAYGLDRFSEDLDFNISNPQKFRRQTHDTLKRIETIGIKTEVIKEELFEKAFTAEINFQGPLFDGRKISLNKFRIDAGLRLGTMLKPEWVLVSSEYPETAKNFLVKCMNAKEMLSEKTLALFYREKGRDLFDAWFLLKKGEVFDKKLFEKKAQKLGKKPILNFGKIVSKKAFEKDMQALTKIKIPYEEIINYLKEKLKKEH